MENTNALATTEIREDGFIVELTGQRKTQFCSFTPKTDDDKIALFNAINNSEKRISECANMPLKIKHIFVEQVTCINEETGEETICPRTVLIDENGEGYTAVSKGVFSSLKNILAIFGNPQDWKKPLVLVPKVISKGNKKITTLSVGK